MGHAKPWTWYYGTKVSFHTFAQEFVKSCKQRFRRCWAGTGQDSAVCRARRSNLWQGPNGFHGFMVSVSVVLCRFADVVWHSFINSWGTFGCCGVPSEVYTEAPRPLYRLAACLYLFDGPETHAGHSDLQWCGIYRRQCTEICFLADLGGGTTTLLNEITSYLLSLVCQNIYNNRMQEDTSVVFLIANSDSGRVCRPLESWRMI